MRGGPLPALHGLPVPIKDLEPVAGLRCTYGSRFYARQHRRGWTGSWPSA